MTAAQGVLPLGDQVRCRRCGKDWTPVALPDASLDLAALSRLDPPTFDAVLACWLGKCLPRSAT